MYPSVCEGKVLRTLIANWTLHGESTHGISTTQKNQNTHHLKYEWGTCITRVLDARITQEVLAKVYGQLTPTYILMLMERT